MEWGYTLWKSLPLPLWTLFRARVKRCASIWLARFGWDARFWAPLLNKVVRLSRDIILLYSTVSKCLNFKVWRIAFLSLKVRITLELEQVEKWTLHITCRFYFNEQTLFINCHWILSSSADIWPFRRAACDMVRSLTHSPTVSSLERWDHLFLSGLSLLVENKHTHTQCDTYWMMIIFLNPKNILRPVFWSQPFPFCFFTHTHIEPYTHTLRPHWQDE